MTQSGSKHTDGQALLDSMDKTIPLKVGFCRAHMMLAPGSVVLDAGCANGETTGYFALKYSDTTVIGVDYDGDYITAAEAKFGDLPNTQFVEADLRDFDLEGMVLDASLNLSVHHEFRSFTGYRTKTVTEILESELHHTRDYGLIINRDFMLPDNPSDIVYMVLPDDGAADGDDFLKLSMAEFFLRYAREANRFDNGNPEGHIKGFFTEEHTDRLKDAGHDVPDGWRVFAVEHQYAWEFVWRMTYRERFLNEADEKYAFWTHNEHRSEPEKIGNLRVLYSAPYENPWLLENRYEPNVKLFDRTMRPLPLPPSNFVSVYQKIPDGKSVVLREHCAADSAPSYLSVSSYKNTTTGDVFDMAHRPGGDVVDILPYSLQDGQLTVYAKDRYPRPIPNIKPRMMTPNLDDKRWSGHMIEPLSAANVEGNAKDAIRTVLCERASLCVDTLRLDKMGTLRYYPAPADLNERVISAHVELESPPPGEIELAGHFSGFSNDGVFRPFDAQSLLQASQTGMLPEARLETNIYALMRQRGVIPGQWLGQNITVGEAANILPISLEGLLEAQKQYQAFKPSETRSGWLDVRRSEFHEVALDDGRERVIAKKELEFIVPSQDVSTNSVILACLVKDQNTGEVLIGVQKISELQSQFASVQDHEGYSGLLTLPGYRLPSSVQHIQSVPEWISQQTGVPKHAIKRLGEAYFPSLGVMPNRIFPHVVTEPSQALLEQCDFVPLRDLFENLEGLEDLHLMNAVFRSTHALGLWDQYSLNSEYN